MKVYVLIQHEEDGKSVEGAFRSKSGAQNYGREMLNESGYEDIDFNDIFEIKQFDLRD